MFYINNKKVKEWIVKGEGNDQFLHRVRSATIDNREFYYDDVSDSDFVDVKVYYKGSRIKTTPQFVRKTQLSSTTITVDLRSEYKLKVLSSISSDVTDFTGTANANPSFKLASTVTSSTVIVYLVPESNIVSTGFYSCILDDTNFTSVSGSDTYAECTFDNAMMYMRDYTGVYSLHKVCSVRAFPRDTIDTGSHENVGYVDFVVVDPPETRTVVNSAGLHFGYLPQQTAEALGFSSEQSPNGISKDSPDYWGWGCWTHDQWFWSDSELSELFSADTDYVRAEDTLDMFMGSTSLTLYHTLHWGIYDLDGSIIESSGYIEDGNTKFIDAWVFDHDGNSLLSSLYPLTETTLSTYTAAYPSPQGTLTLFVPFSQPALEGDMAYLYNCLLQQGLTTDIRSHADNFFNITNNLPEPISGNYTTNITATDGYLYVGETLDNVQCATADNTIQVDSSNKCIYVGARKKDSTLNVTFDSDVNSDIFSSLYFNYYKLIPFIANEGNSTSSDGTINIE